MDKVCWACGAKATTVWEGRDACQDCFDSDTEEDRLREKYGHYSETDLWLRIEELEKQIGE